MKINKIIFSLTIVLASLFSEIAAQGVISGPKKKNESIASTQQTQNKSTSRKSVSLSEPDGYINGHGYVDLGLPSGVKWATCNVGAKKPQQYGGLYRFGDPSNNLYDDEEFVPDVNIIGTKNDAATTMWGESWRTPGIAEAKELLENCIFTDTIYYGVKGVKIIGPSSKSIFLPYSGVMYNYGRSQAGDVGTYQLGECWKEINQFTHKIWAQSYELSFFVNTFNPEIISYGTPSWGIPVRAITD
ncbi:MAG: hypothetical protein K2K75_03675 [Muribaculaceae bacterium]|nr:hypothetical protein [Muribaculaceae bacterium]